MSIENSIEQLSHNVGYLVDVIHKLTLVLERQQPAPASAPEQPTPTPEPQAITTADLQSLCTALVREAPGNKAKIKDTLSSFGAKVLADLKPADYADVKQCLEGMKNV